MGYVNFEIRCERGEGHAMQGNGERQARQGKGKT